MNREELEKMFNEKYKELGIQSDLHQRGVLRNFIFDTIIPEVLKSLDFGNNPEQFHKEYNKIIKVKGIGTDDIYSYFKTKFILEQLQKAKELYNINL